MAGSDDWSLKKTLGMAERRTFSMFYNRRPFCELDRVIARKLARRIWLEEGLHFLNFFQY